MKARLKRSVPIGPNTPDARKRVLDYLSQLGVSDVVVNTANGGTLSMSAWTISAETNENAGWLTVHYKGHRLDVGYCATFTTKEELLAGLEAAYSDHLHVSNELDRIARTMILHAKKAGKVIEAPRLATAPVKFSRRRPSQRAPTAIHLIEKPKKKLPPVTTTGSLLREIKDVIGWRNM